MGWGDLYKLNDDGSVIEHTEVAIENGVSHASVNPKPFESHPTHSFTDALEKVKNADDVPSGPLKPFKPEYHTDSFADALEKAKKALDGE